MDQGIATFPDLTPNMGAEMEFSRGVRPSSCRLWIPSRPVINRKVGTLKFTYGGTTIEFPQAAIAPATLRVFQDRTKIIWTIQIYDRRWKWRYPRISGEYNKRACDGTIITSTKKTLKELLSLLFEELGESQHRLVNVPDNVYPHVNWNRSRADVQLAHLCEKYGCIPLLGLDDIARVERLGTGRDLPNDYAITPKQTYAQAVVPSRVQVVSGPTHYQYDLELEAVALDHDGTVKTPNEITYKPSTGWSSEWYTTFSGVNKKYRHLAFNTMWRWYRVKTPIDIPGLPTINDINQIEFLDHAAEAADDPRRCLPPVVRGLFWDRGDLEIDTDHTYPNYRDDAYYTDEFTILKDRRIVEFAYPVISLGELQGVEPAKLYLTAGFKVRDANGEYYAESVIKDVPGAQTSGDVRIDRHDHLWSGKILKSTLPSGVTYETTSDIQDELNRACTSIVASYNGSPAEDRTYAVIRGDVDLDGAVAQIRFKCGRGAGATTRISRHSEFSVYTPDHQQRRRMDRLVQLADDLL